MVLWLKLRLLCLAILRLPFAFARCYAVVVWSCILISSTCVCCVFFLLIRSLSSIEVNVLSHRWFSLMDTELDTIFFIMDDQRQSLQYTTIKWWIQNILISINLKTCIHHFIHLRFLTQISFLKHWKYTYSLYRDIITILTTLGDNGSMKINIGNLYFWCINYFLRLWKMG